MSDPLLFKSREDHSLLKDIMEVYGKTFIGRGPKEYIRSVLSDALAAMHVTCYMFLILCFDFSKSYNDFSFQKVHLF